MLTSILIGLDGSAYSDVAVELGIQWAKRFNAVLVGLGIVDEPTICKREPVPLGGASYKLERDAQLLADGRRKVEEFLKRFGAQCAAAGVAYQEVEDVGMPYDEILRESHRYDLVLLGHETHFHFETSDERTRRCGTFCGASPGRWWSRPPSCSRAIRWWWRTTRARRRIAPCRHSRPRAWISARKYT